MKLRIIGFAIILLVGVVVLGGCVGTKAPEAGEPAGEVTEEPAVEVEEPVAEEKTPIEIAFDKAKDVEISQAKAKAVDEVLRPVLKGVFDVVVDEEVIVGVKMREEFGPMLTYSFNSKLTEIERDAIISGLGAAGYVETEGNTEKVIQVKKGSDVWTITFYLNNEAKSGLDLTF